MTPVHTVPLQVGAFVLSRGSASLQSPRLNPCVSNDNWQRVRSICLLYIVQHDRGVYVPMPVIYRRLAILGWSFYAISWITPSLHGGGIGARAFIAAVRYGVAFSVHPDSVSGEILGLCLLFGWLANFSIFIPLPVWARIVSIAAPGCAFAAVLLLLQGPLSVCERAASLLYFYPWALGIALIHSANIAEARRARAVRPM